MEIVKQLKLNYKEHHIQAYSGQMAFFLIMSIFPFIVVLFTIIANLSLNSEYLFEFAQIFIPDGIYDFLKGYISTVTFNSSGVLSVSLIFTLWSSSKAARSMMQSLNITLEVEENRGYFRLRLIGVLYTIALIIAILLFLILPMVGLRIFEAINKVVEIPMIYFQLYAILKWVIIILFFFLLIIKLYSSMPNKKLTLRQALPGAVFSVAGWLLTSVSFSFIVSKTGSISIIYGGISVFMFLAFWLYMNSMIILVGGEIIQYYINKK